MGKREREATGASVRGSTKSVAIGESNYGDVHIGDRISAAPAEADAPPQVAERLAGVVRGEWEREAGLRGIDVGLIDVRWQWAVFAPQPDYVFRAPPAGGTPRPLPGVTPLAGNQVPQSGRVTDLFGSLYAQLPYGRLAIAGDASSGKSSMMFALLLGLLDYRRDLADDARDACPVPVWLTATDWDDPEHEPLRAWVARMLAREYGRFLSASAGVVEALVASGRLALFIDGLDELPHARRAAAIRRLDKEERGTRIVVTCRTSELQEADGDKKRKIPLAVIVPSPVDADTVIDYLLSGHPADQGASPGLAGLAKRMHADPEGPVAIACRSPLTLSLIGDVYATGGDPAELLDTDRFATSGDVQGHLLARFLDITYPEQGRWAADRQWLRWLAIQMGDDRNLRWWQIPDWIPTRRRQWVMTLLAGLLVCTALALGVNARGALAGGILGAFRAAFLFPLGETTVRWELRRPTSTEFGQVLRLGVLQAAVGLVLAVALSPLVVAAAMIILAIANSLVYLVTRVWSVKVTDNDDLAPHRSLAGSRRASIAAGVTFGVGIAVSNAIYGWAFCVVLRKTQDVHHIISGPFTAALALAFGLTAGCAAGLPILWHKSLGMSQLSLLLTGRPVNFMKILQEAHERKLLRQAGSVYQFRSAEFQSELRKSGSPFP